MSSKATSKIDPRLLTIEEAAAYCSLTIGGYRAAVRDGRLPGRLPTFYRYDRAAIDVALNRLSGIDTKPLSAFDHWAGEQAKLAPKDRWKARAYSNGR